MLVKVTIIYFRLLVCEYYLQENNDKNYYKKVLIHDKKKESALNHESEMSNQLKTVSSCQGK